MTRSESPRCRPARASVTAVLVLLLGGVALARPAAAQVVAFELRQAVDLSATADSANAAFIGSNPSVLAWNGTTAWVGGYNASGATANTAIAPVTNVLTAPSLGAAFGAISTPASRGLTGLAVQGNTLAAALDTGAGSGDSVRAFNADASTLRWRIGDAGAGNDATRRGDGVAFDPGLNGANAASPAVAYLSIGSGRRHRLDQTNGTYINGQNAGAIINLNPVSTTWRDLAFDPATGDLYARESNRITKATRTGDNTFTGGASTVLAPFTTASTVDNQNIAFVNATDRNFLIANDRSSVSAGQSFFSVVKAVDTSGTALTLDFGSFAPATGNGAYDFAWDAGTQTLAVSDFANRQLYVFGFAVVPEPGTAILVLTALGGAASLGLLRRRPRATR